MEKSLKDMGFIVEREFKKLISHFAEMLEKRGWQSLGEHKEPGCAALVKEFFANGGRGRKESVHQRAMDRLQQREDKYIVQSKRAERWSKVQETIEGARVPKYSRSTYSRERKREGDKENPLQVHC